MCHQATVDMGEVDSLAPVIHDFTLENNVDKELIFGTIRRTCGGCTTLDIQDTSLAPGARTTLHVEVNLAGMTGPFTKTIYVQTIEYPGAPLVLKLKGHAAPSVRVDPPDLRIGKIVADEDFERFIRISGRRPDEQFCVLSISVEPPLFDASLVGEHDKENRYIIRVAGKGELPPGHVSASIIVKTNNARMPVIEIPVHGRCVGALDIVPEAIAVMGHDTPPEMTTRYISVAPGAVRAFRITKVEAPDPSIDVKVISKGSGGFLIRLSNVTVARDISDKNLKIFTDIPELEVIEIPFVIVSAGAHQQPE